MAIVAWGVDSLARGQFGLTPGLIFSDILFGLA
jgi:hypothetical protein